MIEKSLVRGKLLEWEDALAEYALPEWEEFPGLPLYMDQVIYLLNQYLSSRIDGEDEKLVTPAMINNYVKLRIIPRPDKKRYGRVHLAYLVIVCMLKQTLNSSEIRKVMPLTKDEDGVRAMYTEFVGTFREAKEHFRCEVRKTAEPILTSEGPPVTRLIFHAAAAANLSRLLTKQIIRLYPGFQTDEAEG